LPYQITQASETSGIIGSFKYSGTGISNAGIFSPAIAGAGTHRILFTYTSSAGGCVDTASQLVTVMAPPIADFTFDQPACETKNIFFNSTSSTSIGQLTQYTWDFGDGLAAVIKNTPQSFSHIYSKAGEYSVALKVTTSNGCVSSLKQLKVSVRPLPKPNFSLPLSACLPNASVQFINQTSIEDRTENAITYNWFFDDSKSGLNNVSVANSPTHIYSSIGPYNINLKATSGNGCVSDTTIVFNAIHSQPKAIVSIDLPNVCLGNKVIFSSMLSGVDNVATAWNWNFGDGQIDLTRSPEHLYKTASTFDLSLSIKNNFGCVSDTVKNLFTVNPNPTVDIGPDRVVLEGGSIVLSSLVTGTELQYLWSPATYLNFVNTPNPTVNNPLTDIGYKLTITSKGGCKSSDSLFVKILVGIKVPNLFSPNGDGINDRWLIKYLDSYPNCSLQVFTRSGQLVYETRRYTDGTAWDGTLKGKPLPFDTYYYILQPGSGRKSITGYVTIVK
jgi:gliding motility-associated-like protein